MKSPLSLVALLASVLAASAPLAAQTKTPSAAGASDITAGRRIFDGQCAWCHGAAGEGGTAPNLHGRLRHATGYDSIVSIVINGIPGTDMPSFRVPLTDRSARQAAAYVQSLSRAAARPLPGSPVGGAALYDSSGCAACHVVAGRGGVLGPELTNIGGMRGVPYLREALVKPEAAHPPGYLVVRAIPNSGPEVRGIRVNEDVFFIDIRDVSGAVHTLQKSELLRVDREPDASLMPSYTPRLSAAQLDDLVAYLATLRGAR